MFVSSEATILHADLDAFFASVEQRDDPRLRGRPVIVGGGVVLAASYEAKAYGVRTAMGGRAGAPAVPAGGRRPAADVGLRRGEQGACSRCSRTRRRSSRGSRSTRRSSTSAGCERIAGTPTEIAARLRRDVRERVGLPITVGVARTKFLAKVASGVAKPDGLLVVPPGPRARVPAPAAGRAAVGRRAGDGARSSATAGSRPSARSRGSRRRRWWRCSAGRRAGISTRSRTTATRGRCGVGRRRRSIGSQRALGRSRRVA